MTEIEIVKKYFEVSNESDFSEIEKFFTDTSTYSSQNTGLYLGKKDIITMQKSFHQSFSKLQWKIQELKEEKTGIVRVDFDFLGIKDGEEISFSGIEYVVVYNKSIQHIEIKNK